ncbi:MAG: ABC transporter ATP-binding protein [Microgenomates group bacterium]
MLQLKHVSKTYFLEGVEIKALDDVSVDVKEGDFLAIVGPSGSGKSTLMHLIGLLDTPTSGEVFLEGKDVTKMSETTLSKLRNEHIGFVFQQFNLLPRLSALENVELPMIYRGMKSEERHKKAKEMLDMVGLGERLNNRPNQLSGGQQQRVAIARSLVLNPLIILADEPTGNLDTKTGKEILEFLHKLNKEGHTIILVTHDSYVAEQANRHIHIRDGKVVSS